MSSGVDENLNDPEVRKNYLIQNIPHIFEGSRNKWNQFDSIWEEYRKGHGKPWDPIRIAQFMNLFEIANSAPEGDYVELGTHWGLMAKVIWRLMDPSRTLYCFDTFEGFDEKDIKKEKEIYDNNWKVGNFMPTSPEMVAEYIGNGLPPENLTLVKGWIPESFEPYKELKWRFVHIDMDLYQPIKYGLELTWPRLVPGGVLVVHDYGCLGFPGAKVAVDEFFAPLGLRPLPMGDRWGSVMIVKPCLPVE